jgi:hypothetical protein
MSGELSGYSIRQPLQSAPLTGEIMSVNPTERVCTVQVQSQVVDNVTWFGIEPIVGEIVYLTDAGDRMIAVSPRDNDTDVFVNVSGDTMTGPLTLSGAPTSASHAARKADVDAVAAKSVGAGNGLWGGGALSGSPDLHVGAGAQVQVDADSVRVAPYCTSISDWNAANYNGWFMGVNAANAPVGGWVYGLTIAHNSIWCVQLAWPFASGYPEGAMHYRHQSNGGWDSWARVGNFAHSWDTIDNFVTFRHGGGDGVSRWAIGNKKDSATGAASGNDQFRIQRYNTDGVYAGNLMTGSTAGVVNFPTSHTRLAEAMAEGAEVEADRAATVGIVAGMILTALENLGLIAPEARTKASNLFGLTIGEASPDFDPSSVDPPSEPMPEGPPPEGSLTQPQEEAQP